jgi:hypothetical protein
MSGMITLRCPSCGRTQKNTRRKDYDPPTAVIRESECPTCHPEGWREIKWFDKADNRICSE